MFKIKTFNNIAPAGLAKFPTSAYEIGPEIQTEDGIILRSEKLHDMTVNPNLLAVARAGAGVNNVPVDKLSELGIPVFNTPGANANAVKELVIAGMLLACRNICQSWQYTKELSAPDEELNKLVEQGKKKFVGYELPGRTLAVIGLGAIGVKVANAAIALGMNVVGFDPAITIQRAWQLSSTVTQANSIEEALKQADFITVHVPFNEHTKHLINADMLKLVNSHAVLMNFARGGIVDEKALVDILRAGKIAQYVSDFPSNQLKEFPNVISLPHLGASTAEAEENCAVMAAKQLRDFLENGQIHNSVNFPNTQLNRNGGQRIAICNANIPNMVGQISTELAQANINIIEMLNKSRGDVAYTLLDIEGAIPAEIVKKMQNTHGIQRVRVLPNLN